MTANATPTAPAVEAVPRRTVARLLWHKILDEIERAHLQDVARHTGLLLLAAFIWSLWAFPAQAWGVVVWAVTSHSWAAGKAIASIFLVYVGPGVYRWTREHFEEWRAASAPTIPADALIEGCPRADVVDVLFRTGKFLRGDVVDTLGMAVKRHQALAEKLEEVGVLERGPANARVLASGWTRQQVEELLAGCEVAADIKSGLRQVAPGVYSHQ